jgi:predicted methyltransferase
MKTLSRRHFANLAAGVSISLSHAAPARARPSLAAAIASPLRTPKNVARNRYRHPLQILEFFGLRPTQTVLEIDPGAGYWTEILAPYLRPAGRYIAALPAGSSPESDRAWRFFLAKLAANPSAYNAVTVTTLGPTMAPPASVDLVLCMRNLHDWMAEGSTAENLAAIHTVLKPGGIFAIEDHRAATTAPQDPRAKSGYVRQDFAQNLIEQAGFRLLATSNLGANPRDTKSYPKGVWTLPPTLALGQTDRAKYLAIGESDRWTLKFIKSSPALK